MNLDFILVKCVTQRERARHTNFANFPLFTRFTSAKLESTSFCTKRNKERERKRERECEARAAAFSTKYTSKWILAAIVYGFWIFSKIFWKAKFSSFALYKTMSIISTSTTNYSRVCSRVRCVHANGWSDSWSTFWISWFSL